jgi:hypothetical protein
MMIPFMTLTDSASTSAWITAWATVGAVAGTVFTLIIAVLTLRLQVRANLRHQAARIIMHVERHQESAALIVRNTSDLPIADLEAEAILSTFSFPVSIKNKVEDLNPKTDYLAPKTETRMPFSLLADYQDIGAVVKFKDSSGFTWIRQWPSGELKLYSRAARMDRYFNISFLLILLTSAWALFGLSEIVHGPGAHYIYVYNLVFSLSALIFSCYLIVKLWQRDYQTHRKPLNELTHGHGDSAQVREWAKARGIEVNPRGRIKKEILKQYQAEMQGQRPSTSPPAASNAAPATSDVAAVNDKKHGQQLRIDQADIT